nr:hypothetical protein [Pseudomonas sp. LPH1]
MSQHQDSNLQKEKLHPLHIVLISIMGFSILAITLALLIYSNNFAAELSTSHSRWGEFGDFFGGTLNPIFGFLSVIALLLTITLQINEIKQTREAAQVSANALTKQLEISREQAQEQTFFRFLEELKKDEYINTCIKKSQALCKTLFEEIYANGIEDAEREIDLDELYIKLDKTVHTGTIFQYLIPKISILCSIMSEFEPSHRKKYARTVSNYTTYYTMTFIYNLSSIARAEEFEIIKKSGMINGAREDLIFRSTVAECVSDDYYEYFHKNRETLVEEFRINEGMTTPTNK